jgi:hypothetical protein
MRAKYEFAGREGLAVRNRAEQLHEYTLGLRESDPAFRKSCFTRHDYQISGAQPAIL